MSRLLAVALLLIASGAWAQEPPHAPAPGDAAAADVTSPPVALTAEEGQALYNLGMVQGYTQAAMKDAQDRARSALDKLSPPKKR